jgi:alpha-beta hydrolase superfamily lysophospholipase
MIPVSFGNNAARLHLPDTGTTPSGLGVVIVPPHGIEALAAAKTLRLLAEQLAERGHSVLRFDLPGTGDSLDDGLPGDATSCWTESIVDAANTLQTSAGASGIVLVGLRLGALLAASAVPGVENLAGVALLDPVISGKSYARELGITAQAFAEETGGGPESGCIGQGLTIGGLFTSGETLDGMRKLSLLELAPAVPTLLLHRDGAHDVKAMIARWPAMKVTVEPVQGFEAIRSNPTYAVTPHAALSHTADWIDRLPRRALRPHNRSYLSQLTGADFTETSIVFGPDSRLFGVICRPDVPAENSPALIIMNAGRNPHIGWARSSVTLARRLAGDGVATIRFDLGGIGDSVDRPGAADHVDELLYSDDQDAELTAAIELSRSLGFSTTALLGACSGAYLALRGGIQAAGVKNVILVNLQRFVWRNGETVTSALKNNFAVSSSYFRRIGDPRAWRLLLSGERKPGALVLNLLVRAIKRLSRPGAPPETTKAEGLMRTIFDRKSSVDFIYSEDDSGLVELAHHFGPRGRKLLKEPLARFHFVPNSDHNFTPSTARERVYEITRSAILASH